MVVQTSPSGETAHSQDHDEFGDRMKAYEAVEDRRLDPRLPIYARIDGRTFSTFTRGMGRPFDADMTAAMVATCAALVEETHARIGYVQSDEISLVWLADGERAEPIFGGRVEKLCSVLAGFATAAFTAAILRSPLASYASKLPHFDCRVVSLPSKTEMANMILWREMDAFKNAVSMAARAHFSHKALHNRGRADMLAMLAKAGVDFDAYPIAFRHGTFLRRKTFDRAFTPEELAAIPEKHRPAPDALVTRSEVRPLAMPSFVTVMNREAVIFDGADPVLLETSGVGGETTGRGLNQASLTQGGDDGE